MRFRSYTVASDHCSTASTGGDWRPCSKRWRGGGDGERSAADADRIGRRFAGGALLRNGIKRADRLLGNRHLQRDARSIDASLPGLLRVVGLEGGSVAASAARLVAGRRAQSDLV